MRNFVWVACLAIGCSSNALSTQNGDGGGFDQGGVDGGGGDLPGLACGGGLDAKDVASTLTLPQEHSQFAIDLNGDGKVDNQYGNIVGALSAQNLDLQSTVDQSLAAGQLVLLFEQAGATLANDACDTLTFAHGNTTAAPPRFDGTDAFTIDTSHAVTGFVGATSGGTFVSFAPAPNADVMAALPLSFGLGAPISVPLHDVQVRFTRSGDQLFKGQLNGAIRETDVQTMIVPQIAQTLSGEVALGGSSAQQILDLFDTGGTDDSANPSGCTNSDGSPACRNMAGPDVGACARAGDGVISTCEVATNSIIKNVLAPDVQLFAADGTFAPNPANTMRDSLSVGVGFTAVRASF